MHAPTTRRTTPLRVAIVGALAAMVLLLSGCAWGSSASGSASPAASESAQAGDSGSETGSGKSAESGGPVAVGSPIVTPTALERAGNPLGSVREALDTWAKKNCETPDCLVYKLDPADATDACTYVGSDPGPGVEVPEGSTVVLFADCDEVGTTDGGSTPTDGGATPTHEPTPEQSGAGTGDASPPATVDGGT